MDDPLSLIKQRAAPYGLNLIAAIPAERYDRAVAAQWRASSIDPRARSIVVIANGGGTLWAAYRRHLYANPGWTHRDNPLDDFIREVVEREVASALRECGMRCTVVYPFVSNAPGLHFMELGKLAGIGGPSIIGVLVHPVYGPWIAFRAALLLEVALEEPGEALNFDPCPGCGPKSCISACPVSAISSAGWDTLRCLKHRVEVEPDCAARCHSRVACVLGPEFRYPDDELSYHQERALRVMRPYYLEHIAKR